MISRCEESAPPFLPSSSSSSIADDELILTPSTTHPELFDEEEVVGSTCDRSTADNEACTAPNHHLQPPAGVLQEREPVGYVDELEPLRPENMTEGTWAGGWERWKTPLGDGTMEFDVRKWTFASKSPGLIVVGSSLMIRVPMGSSRPV